MNTKTSNCRGVVLRALRSSDAPVVQRFASDQRIADVTSDIPHPYPEGEAQRWLASVAERTLEGGLRVFVITTSDCDELQGVMSLIDLNDTSAEVGYWVGVPYWGQGLASRALAQLCDFARDSLGLETLRARVLLRNPASAKVLERCGFQCVEKATSRCGYRRQDEATAFYLRTL